MKKQGNLKRYFYLGLMSFVTYFMLYPIFVLSAQKSLFTFKYANHHLEPDKIELYKDEKSDSSSKIELADDYYKFKVLKISTKRFKIKYLNNVGWIDQKVLNRRKGSFYFVKAIDPRKGNIQTIPVPRLRRLFSVDYIDEHVFIDNGSKIFKFDTKEGLFESEIEPSNFKQVKKTLKNLKIKSYIAHKPSDGHLLWCLSKGNVISIDLKNDKVVKRYSVDSKIYKTKGWEHQDSEFSEIYGHKDKVYLWGYNVHDNVAPLLEISFSKSGSNSFKIIDKSHGYFTPFKLDSFIYFPLNNINKSYIYNIKSQEYQTISFNFEISQTTKKVFYSKSNGVFLLYSELLP